MDVLPPSVRRRRSSLRSAASISRSGLGVGRGLGPRHRVHPCRRFDPGIGLTMAHVLDRIVVVDVESTCWEGSPPSGERSEIIEIGISTVDITSGQVLDRDSILVRPEHSRVSAFCTQITTLTRQQVDEGIPFREACRALRERHQTKDRLWASYGDYD